MPRPPKRRFVSNLPTTTYYKPRGIPMAKLKERVITIDELEALRLTDHLGIPQVETAKRLEVSQPTLHRILRAARRKVADALANGKALRIQGGTYRLPEKRVFECFKCSNRWDEPFGTGRPQHCPKCQSQDLHRVA